MKSTTKLMVVALMVLVTAAILASPVAARTGTDGKTIASGDTIFVYERGLTLPAGVTQLWHYDGSITQGAVDNTILIDNPTDFDLLAGDVDDFTGIYYFANNAGLITPNQYVNVRYPSASLRVVISGTTDSIDGSSIPRTTDLGFRITNNLAAAFPAGTEPAALIEVTTPNGGKLTSFGGQDMGSIPLTDSVTVVSGVDLDNVGAGTYTAQVKWPTGSDFRNQGVDSNTVSFTVTTRAVSIESNKETVVRGNNFVTTISGESNHDYYVYVQDASVNAPDTYPLILTGQSGVNVSVARDASIMTSSEDIPNTYALVRTTSGGTRPIEWNTTTSTSDKTYTIRVVDAAAGVTNRADDTVRVRVEKGTVTVTAEGTGAFYLGEEITLSGTNTESDTVYLFMTGPNLETNGVPLTNLSIASETDDENTFDTAEVEADDTWEFEWRTGEIEGGLPDAGTYTIYAASAPVDKSDITSAQYQIASVQLRKGFVTATVSNQVVAQGDDLTISGTAEGTPDQLYVWVFGRNFRLQTTADVEDDGTYEYDLENTDTMSTGQYFVIVHHPMNNRIFDIDSTATANGQVNSIVGNSAGTAPNFGPVFLSGLQASDAAQALIDALNSANVDDTYTRLTFLVEAPWITIDPVGDHRVGETFTITGTTNLAEGDQLLVEIQSSAFGPTQKETADGFSGQTGTVEVQAGDAVNTWSFEVDASTFRPDQYIVTVESIEAAQASTSTTFNVVEGGTPTPTVTTTTPATNVTTTVTTAATTTTTTAVPTQPGFGALIALVGLGAVAFLVLRRH